MKNTILVILLDIYIFAKGKFVRHEAHFGDHDIVDMELTIDFLQRETRKILQN